MPDLRAAQIARLEHPRVPGHEVAGVVDAVGAGVSPRNRGRWKETGR